MYGSQCIKQRVIISSSPAFWSKTNGPIPKREPLCKFEASKDPLQIAYFTAHVYDFTETLRNMSNDECSWVVQLLLKLPSLYIHLFFEHNPETNTINSSRCSRLMMLKSKAADQYSVVFFFCFFKKEVIQSSHLLTGAEIMLF